MKHLQELLKLLPKNLISYLIGVLVRLRLPPPLGHIANKIFAGYFGINMAEAELPLADYKTIEDVFTRRLKPGSRICKGDFCSPSDGFLVRSEGANNATAIQAKGLDYSLAALFYGETKPTLDFCWYVTIYLAPPNYHRVHTPVAGKLKSLLYIPGELWPVNEHAATSVPRLFCRNERLVFNIDLEQGGSVCVAMVGAFNVGRIETGFLPGFVTNSGRRQFGAKPFLHVLNQPKNLSIGDELGVFMLGSTVVIGLDEKAKSHFRPVQTNEKRPIMLGDTLQNVRN